MRFPIGIQPRTFELVEITLQKLDYEGPVALSCDDTKLLPSLRPYFDKEKDGYFIMGNAGEPYQLMDPDAFERVVTSGQLQKASKVSSVSITQTYLIEAPLPASVILSSGTGYTDTYYHCFSPSNI